MFSLEPAARLFYGLGPLTLERCKALFLTMLPNEKETSSSCDDAVVTYMKPTLTSVAVTLDVNINLYSLLRTVILLIIIQIMK